jgi:hypothetical protein
MAKPEHEALHRIFQQDSRLFARTMRRVFDIDITEPHQVTVLNVDLTETRPVERRPDSVLLTELLVEGPEYRYIVVIESQTDPEDTKRSRWPYYIAYLHDKYGCPVILLVVCSKAATAEWAREPIKIGLRGLTCMIVSPVVLGPDNVPAIIDLAEATTDVCFTVFSALTHSRSQQAGGILEVLAAALDTVDASTAASLAEFTEAGLGQTAGQQIWRALMTSQTYPYVSQLRSQGREEGREAGRAESRAEDIVRILDRRGISVPQEAREQILSCTDIATLDSWLDRALTATAVSDLFAPEAKS